MVLNANCFFSWDCNFCNRGCKMLVLLEIIGWGLIGWVVITWIYYELYREW